MTFSSAADSLQDRRGHFDPATRPAVPDVIIGGSPRSGTTYLAELLSKHAGVYLAQPIIPEPKVCLTPDPDGDAGLLQRYAKLFAQAPPGRVRIEKTSNYFENEEARARLARLLPDVRYIFILREPVARAYSNWRWSKKNGLEKLPFAEAVALEGARPSPLPPERSYARPFDYMVRGRYGTMAQAWIEAVGRDRIKFYLFESALADPPAFVADLQRFLGVDPLPWSALMTGRINATEPEPNGIDPLLAAQLQARIRPEVERLTAVTGLDVSIWGY